MVIPVWSASVHPGREVVGIRAEAQTPAAGAQSLPKASLNSKKHITVVATFGAGCQTLACLAFRAHRQRRVRLEQRGIIARRAIAQMEADVAELVASAGNEPAGRMQRFRPAQPVTNPEPEPVR